RRMIVTVTVVTGFLLSPEWALTPAIAFCGGGPPQTLRAMALARQIGSLCQSQAAVDGDHLAGHPFRTGLGQSYDPARHVIGFAAPLQRYRLAFLALYHCS